VTDPHSLFESPHEIERRVLLALCSALLTRDEWLEIQRELANYTWRVPDHAVVYQAILRVRTRGDSRNWRERLPVEATLMGFPDLDWSAFSPKEPLLPEPDLRRLIRELAKAAGM
jgi:hypothetical protein